MALRLQLVFRASISSCTDEFDSATVKRSLLSRVRGRLRGQKDPPAPRLASPSFRNGEVAKGAPIFVIGCQRSGTSLLRRIVDSHSNIACPPESKFILPITELLTKRKYLAGFGGMGYDRDEVATAIASFVRSFFDSYALSLGKSRWADKTPNYVECLPELWELFGPSVRFVHILRHGLDVAFSLSDDHRHYPAIDDQVALAGGDRAVGAGRFWAIQNEKMESFRKVVPEACFTIRYEDLTADPESALKPMFDFLHEPWEPQVIEYTKFSHHAGWEDPDVQRYPGIVRHSERYRAWPEEVQRAVLEACEPVLSRLGYA